MSYLEKLYHQPINIQPHLLVKIYLTIFIGFFLVAVDKLLLSSDLQQRLPVDPNEFLIFTLVFTMPHILASFFSFADKDYLKEYGTRLLRGAQVIAVAAIALPVISLDLTFIIFALFTMIHVFMQQSGVSKSLMRGANKYHFYWQWLGIIISIILYLSVYSTWLEIDGYWQAGLWALIGLMTVFGVMAARASKTKLGTQYFWLTGLLPVSGYLFLLMGYPILAIAIPRIVHDLTAFSFYIAHDHNRYLDKPQNLIYSLVSNFKLPILIASPLLAVLLALPFQYSQNNSNIFTLSMFVFLFHYYVESFIWKRGSLHRRYATPL